MSLTEQVLLHRDAQLLGMEIVSEPSSLVQQLGVVDQSSASARPGELSEEFRKLFNLKQKALFTLPGGSDAVQTSLSAPSVSVATSISTTEGFSKTSVPVSSLMSRADSCPAATLVSTTSSRTSVLVSSSPTTSSVVTSSPSVVEEGVQLDRDGILGQQGECLSANKLGEISSKLFLT